MSWGLGGWGIIPWGDGQDLGSQVIVSGPRLACADVMAQDLLLLTFNVTMANNTALKAASNYRVIPEDIDLPEPRVISVLSGNLPNPQQIFLVVSPFVLGATYDIVVNPALRSIDNTALDSDGLLAKFVGRKTKIDYIVRSRPQMYDMRPASLMRTLLNAIGREDDIIGGSRKDRIACFLHTTTTEPSINQVEASLAGMFWALPSLGVFDANTIFCAASAQSQTTIIGAPSGQYSVQLRFRGVVEQKSYTGGTNDGAFFQTGGTPVADTYGTYALTISSPAQTYYLNRGTSGNLFCNGIDYTKTVTMDTGAIVTLSAVSQDGKEIKNQDNLLAPISVSGVSAVSQPYNGQFIQMDVVSIVKL